MSTPELVVRRESRARSMWDYYATTMRTQLQTQFQYRAAVYAYMAALVIEPVIYLVVWTSIAESQGGAIQGITVGQLSAYYVVWTLVRGWNVVFTPFGWEWRIREGQFSAALLRPQHPIHYELAWWAGQKIVWFVFYLPVFFVLVLVFKPALHPRPEEIAVFAVAIWGAWFPFKWTFWFPIEALSGDMSNQELLRGLGFQLLWIAICALAMKLVWRLAARHYTAVGN